MTPNTRLRLFLRVPLCVTSLNFLYFCPMTWFATDPGRRSVGGFCVWAYGPKARRCHQSSHQRYCGQHINASSKISLILISFLKHYTVLPRRLINASAGHAGETTQPLRAVRRTSLKMTLSNPTGARDCSNRMARNGGRRAISSSAKAGGRCALPPDMVEFQWWHYGVLVLPRVI